jgi:hypothetical protein
VSDSSGRQIEDQAHTSSAPASGSRLQTRTEKFPVYFGLGLTAALVTVALVSTIYPDTGSGQKHCATRPIPPTNTAQPTSPSQPASPSQPNNPPRAIVGREERDLGRGISTDTSGEPYPNLHILDDIADGVLTTAGSSEAGSFSNQDR